jgi:hypothetical protein
VLHAKISEIIKPTSPALAAGQRKPSIKIKMMRIGIAAKAALRDIEFAHHLSPQLRRIYILI